MEGRSDISTRRQVLATLGVAGSLGLAGCSSLGGDGETEENESSDEELPSPTASFEVTPTEIDDGEEVTVDASGSEPPEGERIEEYEWAFGDTNFESGDIETTGTISGSGEQTVRLRVTDSQGQTDTAERTVTVVPSLPSFKFNVWPATPSVNQEIRFEAVDPILPDDISVEEYAWAFGENASFETTGADVTHVFEEQGEHTVRLRVTDSRGRESTTEDTVEILDRMPEVTFEVSPTEDIDTATEVTFTADEPELEEGISVSGYEWAFGEDASLTESGKTVTHTFEEPGDIAVRLRVTDEIDRIRETNQTVTVLPTFEDTGDPEPVVEEFVTALDEGRTEDAYALFHPDGPAEPVGTTTAGLMDAGTFEITSDISRVTEERTRMELAFTLKFDESEADVVYELRLDGLEWRIWRYSIP